MAYMGSGTLLVLRYSLYKMEMLVLTVPIDTFGGAANGNPITLGMNLPEFINKGFAQRAAQAAQSSQVFCWIPLKNMFLFCRSYDKVSRGLRHKLVLNRNDDNIMLFRDPNTPGAADRLVVLSYISCWIPRLKPNLETLKMLEGKLASNELYTVNFTDLTVWQLNTLQTGNASQSAILLATTTKKPIRMWVVFQRKERVDPGQTVNRRVFDNLNTTNIQCRLNGRQYPLYEYKIINICS